MRMSAVMSGVLLIAAGLVAGCVPSPEVPYIIHAAIGQLSVQGDVEPIDDVLADDRLTAEEEEKLELIVKARDYAANTIGLDAGNSYTTFYDTAGDPLAFNLSAAARDRLEAKTWTFPVIGQVPYLAFFDESYMQLVEALLKLEGYDTYTYELDAYSTLGFFDDPVRSTMLRRNKLSLADTIIHELLHNTIYRPNDTEFNESLATFVGRRGAVAFLTAEYGEDSGWAEYATALYADIDRINAFLLDLYERLDNYYARSIGTAEKVAGREDVFAAARQRFVDEVQPTLTYPDAFDQYAELPANNAWVLAHYRYNLDLDLMAAVHAATGEDWSRTLDVFRAAATAEGDPFDYLRNWVAENTP
jgi:predicted aminopeptidase